MVFVENVRQFNRISTDSNKRPYLDSLDQPKKVRIYYRQFHSNMLLRSPCNLIYICDGFFAQCSVVLMDAEDYSNFPDSQFEEDNVLRELNKCLIAFRQNTTCPIIPKHAPRTNRRLNSLPSIDSNHESESVKDKERNNAQRR